MKDIYELVKAPVSLQFNDEYSIYLIDADGDNFAQLVYADKDIAEALCKLINADEINTNYKLSNILEAKREFIKQYPLTEDAHSAIRNVAAQEGWEACYEFMKNAKK